MIKGILDTDILSEIGKGVSVNVLNNATNYVTEHGQLSFTSISVYEQLYGLEARAAPQQIERFLRLIASHEEVVPLPTDYRLAASIRAALQLAGTPIGSIDPIIAACALNRDVPLITGNTRHHSFIQSAGYALQLLNWRDANAL